MRTIALFTSEWLLNASSGNIHGFEESNTNFLDVKDEILLGCEVSKLVLLPNYELNSRIFQTQSQRFIKMSFSLREYFTYSWKRDIGDPRNHISSVHNLVEMTI